MRENMGIYRGKRVDNGEMVKGFYSCVTDNYTPKNRCYITTFKSLDNGEIVLTGQFEVIPETVGQFTGRTDRNGNKIFEGDIVQAALDGRYYSVEYITDDEYAFNFVDVEKGYTYSLYDFNDVIVIGNIHDNPELLGGSKNGFGL